MTDCHAAIGQDVLAEPAAQCQDVEVGGRERALPGVREVTVRSLRDTMRLLEMATLKTYGARDVQDGWPWGWAWLWPFQVVCQTRGSICASSPA